MNGLTVTPWTGSGRTVRPKRTILRLCQLHIYQITLFFAAFKVNGMPVALKKRQKLSSLNLVISTFLIVQKTPVFLLELI